ncbi:sodium- and chloride-dependent glycine transporter 2-like [Littorina saxatilis]|uniref:sodium- and chloride-dependent glycine transporter 2-like n=1 Tax=Littorina saxatilis TaxID=31220 RepID=UPI0038B63A3D
MAAASFMQDSHCVKVLLDEEKDGEKTEGGRTPKEEERNGHTDAGDEEYWTHTRHSWSKKREYILSMMGYIVGIGNVWRFPYICIRNGGGAFLLPFLLCLVLVGLPLFFLESALGQFSGRSSYHAWMVCPLVKGVGIAMCILSTVNFWYFNIILAWTLYYIASSFHATVPWSRCDQWWNTPRCIDYSDVINVTSANVTSANASSTSGNDTIGEMNYTSSWFNVSLSDLNLTEVMANDTDTVQPKPVSAAEEFWQHNVLQVSGGLYETGHVVWYLAVSQCIVVLIIFLALIKGVKSSGKVVYVTATLPYLLLTVLLVRGATLPGAKDGILYYLTPDFSRLLDPQVWVEAALQVFYSLGPAWGSIITMASYNHFNNNCLRDAVCLSLLGEGTSVFGGFAIFSVLGYMGFKSGVAIKDVVSSGPGLAFIVYPEAISLMPLPQLWAVLFFLMVVTLVIDTQLATGETVLTVLCDQFPRVLGRHRMLVTATFCVLALLTSFGLVSQGGIYVFQLVDWFIATYTVTVVALLECVVLAWVYGADRFCDDIQLMIGKKPLFIFKIIWCFLIPSLLVVLLVFTLMRYEAPSIGDYTYDSWGNTIGWMIATGSFLPIPAMAVYQLIRAKGSFLQRLKQTTSPDENWGPSDPARRRLYRKEMMQRSPRRHWLDVIR